MMVCRAGEYPFGIGGMRPERIAVASSLYVWASWKGALENGGQWLDPWRGYWIRTSGRKVQKGDSQDSKCQI